MLVSFFFSKIGIGDTISGKVDLVLPTKVFFCNFVEENLFLPLFGFFSSLTIFLVNFAFFANLNFLLPFV